MPRIKPTLTRLLTLACLVLLLAGAHWTGRRLARSGILTGSKREILEPIADPDRSHGSGTRPETMRAEETAAVVAQLKTLAASSPFPGPDIMADMRRLIATLPAAELPGFFAGLDPYVEKALALEVARAWISKDPAAALVALSAKFPDHSRWGAFEMKSVFLGWAQDHPAAALGWLDSSDFPASLTGRREQLRMSALGQLAERDFPAASESCRNADSETRQSILQLWANPYSIDPAMRQKLIDFARSTGDPGDDIAFNASLVRSWPQEDSVGMMNYLLDLKKRLESGSIPPESQSLAEASAVGAAIVREYDRPALEWWMERHSADSEVPAPLQDAFTYWIGQAPAKVDQWLAEQPASPQRDALRGTLATSLATRYQFPQAIEQIGQISDPEIKRQTLAGIAVFWADGDSAASGAAWGKALSGK